MTSRNSNHNNHRTDRTAAIEHDDDFAYRGAIALNNMGVALLQKKYFVEAYETLQDASRIMRQWVSQATSTSRTASPASSDQVSSFSLPLAPAESATRNASDLTMPSPSPCYNHPSTSSVSSLLEKEDVSRCIDTAARRLATTTVPPSRVTTRSASTRNKKNSNILIHVLSDDWTSCLGTSPEAANAWDMILLSPAPSSPSLSSSSPHVFFPIRIEVTNYDADDADTYIDVSSCACFEQHCAMKCAILLHNVAITSLLLRRSSSRMTMCPQSRRRTTTTTRKSSAAFHHRTSPRTTAGDTDSNHRNITAPVSNACKLLELSYALILRRPVASFTTPSHSSSPSAASSSPPQTVLFPPANWPNDCYDSGSPGRLARRPAVVDHEQRRVFLSSIMLRSLVQALHHHHHHHSHAYAAERMPLTTTRMGHYERLWQRIQRSWQQVRSTEQWHRLQHILANPDRSAAAA